MDGFKNSGEVMGYVEGRSKFNAVWAILSVERFDGMSEALFERIETAKVTRKIRTYDAM